MIYQFKKPALLFFCALILYLVSQPAAYGQIRTGLAIAVSDTEGQPLDNVRITVQPEPCTAGMKEYQIVGETDEEGELYVETPFGNPPCLWIRWNKSDFLFPLSAYDSGDLESPYVLASQSALALSGGNKIRVDVSWKFLSEELQSTSSDGVITGKLIGTKWSPAGKFEGAEPLAGTIVSIESLNRNAVADVDGKFKLTDLPRDRKLKLQISYQPADVNDQFEVIIPWNSDLDLGATLYYYLPEQ